MEKNLLLKEELEANQFVTKSLLVWGLVYVVAEILNEVGLFYVPKMSMRISTLTAAIVFLVCLGVNEWEKKHKIRNGKFFIMGAVVILAFVSFTLLSFHALIIALVPIVTASYYNDRRMLPAVIVITAILIPVSIGLSIVLGTFSDNFLESLVMLTNPEAIEYGYLIKSPQNIELNSRPVLAVLLYYGLPTVAETIAFGYLAWCVYRGRTASHKRQIDAIKNMQDDFTVSMSEIIEGRDEMTGGHTKRTRDVIQIFINEIRKHDKEHDEYYWDTIIKTAPLHDLGKIAIDDAILRKPGRLTDEEYEKIQKHASVSGALIEKVYAKSEDREYAEIAKNIGMYHHERWDGRGYPEGLSGENIPYEARIMAYVDVTDALLSKRSYKEKCSFEETLGIIKGNAGTQFDPGLLADYENAFSEIKSYYKCLD